MADGKQTKRAIARATTKYLVNPLMRPLIRAGLAPTHAILETTGRRSGQPRQVPVGNGLRGDDFWIVTEHGYHAAYVKNIQANPNVRVRIGRHWRTGVAEILPDDDPRERMRKLGRPVNDTLVKLVGTEEIVIRIRLES